MPLSFDIAGNFFTPAGFKSSATIGSTSNVEVIPAAVMADGKISEIGRASDGELSLIVKVGVTATEGDVVSFRSVDYRISRIETDAANITKKLYLIPKYGGA